MKANAGPGYAVPGIQSEAKDNLPFKPRGRTVENPCGFWFMFVIPHRYLSKVRAGCLFEESPGAEPFGGMFHNRTVPSVDELASVLPSGENAAE